MPPTTENNQIQSPEQKPLLRLIPLDDAVVLPNMGVTITVDVGDDERVVLVPRHENEFLEVGTIGEVSERVRLPGGADQRPVLAGDGDGASSARQADLLGDLSDRAHVDELVVVARDEHHSLVLPDVDRERDPHVGKHDGVIQRDQSQERLLLG